MTTVADAAALSSTAETADAVLGLAATIAPDPASPLRETTATAIAPALAAICAPLLAANSTENLTVGLSESELEEKPDYGGEETQEESQEETPQEETPQEETPQEEPPQKDSPTKEPLVQTLEDTAPTREMSPISRRIHSALEEEAPERKKRARGTRAGKKKQKKKDKTPQATTGKEPQTTGALTQTPTTRKPTRTTGTQTWTAGGQPPRRTAAQEPPKPLLLQRDPLQTLLLQRKPKTRPQQPPPTLKRTQLEARLGTPQRPIGLGPPPTKQTRTEAPRTLKGNTYGKNVVGANF